MKKTTWLLAALVALVVWGGWKIYERREAESAYGLLEQARALIESDPDQAVLAQLMLDRGLAFHPPPALTEALLTERAELRTQVGALGMALDDWYGLLAKHPDDAKLKLKIAGLESRVGNRDGALAIYNDLLEEKPNNGWYRSMIALENSRAADELWADTLEVLEDLISRKDALWLRPRFEQIVRLPVDDPARKGLLTELDERLSEDAQGIIQPAIAALSNTHAKLRSDYAISLKNSVNTNNLYGLIDSFYQARRLEDTVDLGLALLPFRASTQHPGTIQDLVLALDDLGRPKAAAVIAGNAMAENPDWHADFLDGWCSILYRAENWPQLENAATQLMRSSHSDTKHPERPTNGAFYFGIATFHQGRNSAAIGALKQFIASRTPGPVPDAIGQAWVTTAEAHRALGNHSAASSAWYSCTRVAPDDSFEAWLHMADDSAHVETEGLAEANAVAHMISIEPARAAELLPRFEAAGQRGLSSRGIKIPALAAQLEAGGRWYPSGHFVPYTLFALARYQLESAEPAGAAIILEHLLSVLPRFVPALDQLALTQLVLDQKLKQAETLLGRLAISGPNAAALAQLKDLAAKLEGQELPAPLLRRWMQLDPDFVGALELARALEANDRPAEAMATLTGIPRELFNDRDRILFAEILAGLGERTSVLEATRGVSPMGPYATRATLLRIQAAADLEDLDELTLALDKLQQLRPVIQANSPEDVLVEHAFSTLLDKRLGPALLRFANLIQGSTIGCQGRHVNQAALAEAIFGDHGEACACADAADALSEDGAPIVGRLALAEAVGDLDGMLRAVRDLRLEAPEWLTDADLAFMSGIEGRTGEARAQIEEALLGAPSDSRLWLARAALDSISPAGATDTSDEAVRLLGPAAKRPLEGLAALNAKAGRRLLTILLAFDAPVWKDWALDAARAPIQDLILGPFAMELRARAALARGDLKGAQDLLLEGAAQWKAFLPFWDLNEDLALVRHGRPDHPAVVALRRKRRQAGVPPRGGQPPTAAELALDASFEAASKGLVDEALTQAKLANNKAPDAAAPLLNLARVAAKPAPQLSRKSYLQYLLSDNWSLDREERSAIFKELFALPTPLEPKALEQLAERFPDNPEPVLGRSRIEASAGNLAAAFDRLETFATNHAALESLSPDSSRPWFEFLLSYSPQRALAFTGAQLDLDPRWLDPWVQRALALEANAQRDEALELWDTLARMTPDPRVARGRAALLASTGGAHSEVIKALNLARRGADAKQFSGLVDFINARSLANIGEVYFDPAIEALEKLLATKSTPGVSRQEIERRLGTTLLHRAHVGDGPRAMKLLTAVAKQQQDPLEHDLLIGLSNLGQNLDRELAKRTAEAEEAAAKAPAPKE